MEKMPALLLRPGWYSTSTWTVYQPTLVAYSYGVDRSWPANRPFELAWYGGDIFLSLSLNALPGRKELWTWLPTLGMAGATSLPLSGTCRGSFPPGS